MKQIERTSRMSGFYRLSPAGRRQRIAEFAGLSDHDVAQLSGGLPAEIAEHMVENVAGGFELPLGFAPNFRIDSEDYVLPMAVEEPSVVAAAANGARLLRAGTGITTTTTAPIMIAQVQILDIDDPDAAMATLLDARERLVDAANRSRPSLVRRGGGCRDLTVRNLGPTRRGPMLVVHLHVDVRDAMGANLVTGMAEHLAPHIEALTGGRVGLRILSNLASERTVTAVGRVPFAALDDRDGPSGLSGREIARRIDEASAFAEVDPYRAATHNKGIMNGIDAVLLPLGQDWRAIEAGAHAWAARTGHYGALATWRVDPGGAEQLIGELTLPMQVGTVGGVIGVHPLVDVLHKIVGVRGADHLGRIAAAAGLAQNLTALSNLATCGILRGHMALHARNIAAHAGARPAEIDAVVQQLLDGGQIDSLSARRAVRDLREPTRDPARLATA